MVHAASGGRHADGTALQPSAACLEVIVRLACPNGTEPVREWRLSMRRRSRNTEGASSGATDLKAGISTAALSLMKGQHVEIFREGCNSRDGYVLRVRFYVP
jgi:hypothetical protein